jgi:pantothenate kinase
MSVSSSLRLKPRQFSLASALSVVPNFDPVTYLQARPESRFILGVTGPPGAGKSTFAEWLVNILGGTAIVLPMDGFHLRNAELETQGLRQRKGAPDTYDVASFVALLRQLRSEGEVAAPAYSRITHEPELDAIRITPGHRIVIVEGNYLLVTELGWDEVKPALDEVWYLDVSAEEAARRLRDRHTSVGRSADEADMKVRTVDLPNGEIVARTRDRADRWISMEGERPARLPRITI